jgi:hypothetical protein
VRLNGEEEGIINKSRRLSRADPRRHLVAQRLAE